jgi:hypothetical protein
LADDPNGRERKEEAKDQTNKGKSSFIFVVSFFYAIGEIKSVGFLII